MSAEPIDPVAVREARKRLAATLADRDRIDASVPEAWKVDDDEGVPHIMVPLAEFRLLLRVLDEGREASAPIAGYTGGPSGFGSCSEHTAVYASILPSNGMLVGHLRRLAAWNTLFTEPEEKNDVR